MHRIIDKLLPVMNCCYICLIFRIGLSRKAVDPGPPPCLSRDRTSAKGNGMRFLAMTAALALASTAMQPVAAQTAPAPQATQAPVEYDIAFPRS